MFRLPTAFILAVSFLIPGCSQPPDSNFQTTQNGLRYQFHTINEGNQKVQLFDVVEVLMNYRTIDSLLFSSYPQTIPFQIEPVYDGDLMEGLMLMHLDDSATLVVNTDDFYRKMMQFAEIPNHSRNSEYLFFDIKMVKIIPETARIRARRIDYNDRKRNEETIIQGILDENGVKSEPLENGLYLIRLMEGSGKSPKIKDKVEVHYSFFFAGGIPFKSSLETNRPIVFEIGSGEVLAGLELGVQMLSEGGSARLLVPSKLAYGGVERDEIKPFTPMIFDIDLIKIIEH